MANPNHTPALTLLAVDNDEVNLELVDSALQDCGVSVLKARDAQAGLDLFVRERPPIVLVDLMMPGMDGLQLLERILAVDPGADVILMTGHYSTESAVLAIQSGAADYLTKPLDLAALKERITKYVADAQCRKRILQLEQELLTNFEFEGMVGRSPLMLDVFAKIRRVAPHFRTVLLAGATGTGKELVARALHLLSPAASKTFAVCNCSAVVDTLFESELFGYVRGAFTGAMQDKIGLFEFAHRGTVFLDEIGELPLAAQAKLLRVLQNQEVQRVGSPAVRKVDVRVVTATNRDLHAMVAEKSFREDLYYRLSMVTIQLPRLAERKEDLPLLQRHFLAKFSAQYHKPIAGLTRRAQTALARYTWPGNVRELENVLGSACMMAEDEIIDFADLPASVTESSAAATPGNGELVPLHEVEARYARKVLAHMGGDKTRAAQVLGIARGTLYKILGTPATEREAS